MDERGCYSTSERKGRGQIRAESFWVGRVRRMWIAAEAKLHQATNEATFRGQARLWQQANSIMAPVIVLDRERKTLVAHSANGSEPVRAVLVSAAGAGTGKEANKANQLSVIRVRGGDLKYSDVERRAVMRGGSLGTVVAETGTATSTSNEVEVTLLPSGSRAVQGQRAVAGGSHDGPQPRRTDQRGPARDRRAVGLHRRNE